MTLLDTVNVGETDYGMQSRVPMGTCATPAGSEVKVCAFADNFSLSAGNLIAVTFTYANTYGDGSTTYPKLTINGTQYPVKFPTGEYASSGAWANGQAVTFMFDGTNLLMTTLPVVNEVALDNMYSVSSDAVAEAIYGSTPIVLDKGSVVYQENMIRKIGNSYVISLSTTGGSFFTDGDLAHYDSNFMPGNKVVACSVYDNTKWSTGVLYFHGGYVSLLIPNITTVIIIACSGAVV